MIQRHLACLFDPPESANVLLYINACTFAHMQRVTVTQKEAGVQVKQDCVTSCTPELPPAPWSRPEENSTTSDLDLQLSVLLGP